jgi:hypothetical protein
MWARLAIALLTVVLVQPGGGSEARVQGGGGGPIGDPTPFERFVDKLKLDGRTQLPAVQAIFTRIAGEAAPLEQELHRVRQQMVRSAGQPDELARLTANYAAAAAKMTATEVRAFDEVRALLKPNQLSKSGEAFVLMAGMFQPETPRSTRRGGRGGGQ